MELEIGIGTSIAPTPREAAKRACRRALAELPNPTFALVFSSASFDHGELLAEVNNQLGGVPLCGTSGAAGMTNAGFSLESVIVVLFSGKGLSLSGFSISGRDDPEKAGFELGREILKAHPDIPSRRGEVAGLLFADEYHFRGAGYIRGLHKGLGFPLALTGGGSLNAGGTRPSGEYFNGFQFFNDRVFREHLQVVLLEPKPGSGIRFSYSFSSSWLPVARPVTVTRADGPVVSEVDGMPFRDYLFKIFGQDVSRNLHLIGKYIFIQHLPTPFGEKCLVRSPIAFDPQGLSCRFFPDVDLQGAVLQLSQTSREELLNGVRGAAESALSAQRGFLPRAALLFSCHMRNGYLHSMVSGELEQVRNVFGDSVAIAGIYSGGEYSPLFDSSGDCSAEGEGRSSCSQLSTSMAMMLIGEDSSERPKTNWRGRLSEGIETDKKDFFGSQSLEETIGGLVRKLETVEEDLSRTEVSLKMLNSRHFETAIELEARNRELKILSDSLAAKTAQLEAVFKGSNEGICFLDPDGRVVFQNDQFGRMLGTSRETFDGRNLLEVLAHLPGIEIVRRNDEEAGGQEKTRPWIDLKTSPGTGVSGRESEEESFLRLSFGKVGSPEGSSHLRPPHESLSGTPHLRPPQESLPGTHPGSVGVLFDITLERRMNEAKTEFVRHVAHELRTPLTSIGAYSEMLLDGDASDTATQREYLTIINSEADRLTRMINELLDIARIESGRRELRPSPLDLRPHLERLKAILDSQTGKAGHSLLIEIPAGEFPILADPDLLDQALLNLAGNAIKYSPDGGEVRVKAENSGDDVLVRVSDQGIGISTEDQKRLFQKFFRVRTDRTKEIVGTGLGLATVKSIMDAHGGRIEVSSEAGKGSTFTLSFPTRHGDSESRKGS